MLQIKYRYSRLLLAAAALPAVASAQGAPAFSFPVDCRIGKSCVIQNYVDRDPGPAARDYRCGFLTYDGHKGTDIRVIDAAALQQGVAVVAAAPGRVRAVRDGMPDVSVRTIDKEALAGKYAGNTVVIEHGDGWETQYAHLRRGSVAVNSGETVERGRKLGVVGLSGNTEFWHLHFEVRHQRKTVDPFIGLGAAESCKPGGEPSWRSDVLAVLDYIETGVLDAGISGSAPVLNAGIAEHEGGKSFNIASGAVIFWVQIFGTQADDVEEMKIVAPDGRVLVQRRARITRNQAQWLIYTGARRGGSASWPPGVYRGEYRLFRGPQEHEVLAISREARIAP